MFTEQWMCPGDCTEWERHTHKSQSNCPWGAPGISSSLKIGSPKFSFYFAL